MLVSIDRGTARKNFNLAKCQTPPKKNKFFQAINRSIIRNNSHWSYLFFFNTLFCVIDNDRKFRKLQKVENTKTAPKIRSIKPGKPGKGLKRQKGYYI